MTDYEKDRDRRYECWLCSVPGIGNRTIEKLRKICPSAEDIWRMGDKLWSRVLNVKQLEEIQKYHRETHPENLWERMLENGISFVCIEDTNYPSRLAQIPDAPYGLFFKGKLPEESRKAVAVIGARDCSEYGKYVAVQLGQALGKADVQVISGMARGIDGISQWAALEAGGNSFGVLGSGVDVCYPASNRELYDRLCGQGGILSSYAPGTAARAQNFPPRNRIVSGLADALVVVEARNQSGTLITVDMALEQGKDVYVVPGRVTDRLSDGCNRLLKQGAGVILSPEEFLEELGVGDSSGRNAERKRTEQNADGETETEIGWKMGKKVDNKNKADKLREEMGENSSARTERQRGIYEILDLQPMYIEDIRERMTTKYSLAELMAELMEMCVEGSAVQVSSGWFCRRGV